MTSQLFRKKGQRSEYPLKVKAGNVVITIYEISARTNKNGKAYRLVWSTPFGTKNTTRADPAEALEEARIKAAQLAAGRIEGAEMTRTDRDELAAARRMTLGKPLLSVLEEWKNAHELTGGLLMEAARIWAQKHGGAIKRVLAPKCVDEFIDAKNKDGAAATRTYRSKLADIKTYFKDRYLDDITTDEWTGYLRQWEDGVTRNDLRKRAIAMCKWARDEKHYLTRGVQTEVEHTKRVKEEPTTIGILTPEVYHSAVRWMRDHHPEYLAPLILAGFCGIRADEIHGKRTDRDKAVHDENHPIKRQTWEDIHITKKVLNVTNAKENTPARRIVPVCDTAIELLKECPGEKKGFVCEPGAMEDVRTLLKKAGYPLPENCFRHSFISYRIAVTQSKEKVAIEAGNSTKEIDKSYRVPLSEEEGKSWFSFKLNVQ